MQNVIKNIARKIESYLISKGFNEHSGLFWSIDNVTGKNYNEIFDLIVDFVKMVEDMNNRIVKLEQEGEKFVISQFYPIEITYLHH